MLSRYEQEFAEQIATEAATDRGAKFRTTDESLSDGMKEVIQYTRRKLGGEIYVMVTVEIRKLKPGEEAPCILELIDQDEE